MHIRRAQAADLYEASGVTTAALCNDDLHLLLCPRLHEYFGDYRATSLRRIRKRFYGSGYVLFVAVTDEEDEAGNGEGQKKEAGKIVGYSAWLRAGKGEDAKRWQDRGGWWVDVWCNIQRYILMAQDYIVVSLGLDRSIDRSVLKRVEAMMDESFPSSAFPELWYLATLAVHPDYQRRGIGKKLVLWGVQQGENEGVPVALEASADGKLLYEKCGFQLVRTESLDGLPVPLMICEPPGTGENKPWADWMKKGVEDKKTK